jgi:hypothetical protein
MTLVLIGIDSKCKNKSYYCTIIGMVVHCMMMSTMVHCTFTIIMVHYSSQWSKITIQIEFKHLYFLYGYKQLFKLLNGVSPSQLKIHCTIKSTRKIDWLLFSQINNISTFVEFFCHIKYSEKIIKIN